MKRTNFLTTALIAAGLLVLSACDGAGVRYSSYRPPPAIRVEAYGVAPGPGYVWVGGYWGGRPNNYVWVPGRWSRPPRAGAVWVAPRWEQRGRDYRFQRGRWR